MNIDHPLNLYLMQLRELEKNYFETYSKFPKDRLPNEVEKHQLKTVAEQRDEIAKKYPLEARNFDIFTNKVELTLAEYEAEFPKPELTIKDCQHETIELRLRINSNNSSHIVQQCLLCGESLKCLKKEDVKNWKSLPPYDEKLGKEEKKLLQEWYKKRDEIKKYTLWEGDKLPAFNEEQFKKEYEKNNPVALCSSICEHVNQIITLRVYSNKNNAIVSQCIDCGKHVRAISKSQIPYDYQLLAGFDESLEKNQRERYHNWYHDYFEASKKAHILFKQQLQHDIKNGKYNFIYHDTYNTYYDSIEWLNTRTRIIERDSHICQACQTDATCVHHMTYTNLGKESDLELISLCTNCHQEVHKRQNLFPYSYKLTPKEIMTLWYWDFVIRDSQHE